jgi:hypothetical protein
MFFVNLNTVEYELRAWRSSVWFPVRVRQLPAIFVAPAALVLSFIFFCDVNLCNTIDRIRRFERQLRFIETSGLGVINPWRFRNYSFETSGFAKPTTQRNVPEEQNPRSNNLFSETSEQTSERTQPPINYIPPFLTPGVKRPEFSPDYSPHYGAKMKNEWSYASAPLIRLHCGEMEKFIFLNRFIPFRRTNRLYTMFRIRL